MNTRFGFVACLAMAMAAMVHEASVSYGQFPYTNAQADGNWATPGTWSLGEPTDTQPAAINGGFTVTLDQFGAITNLLDVGTIATETGTLNIAGGDLFITDSDTTTEPNIPSFRVGTANGATGVVNMTGGDVFIGDAAGSDIGNGEFLVGDNGIGTANISGGVLEAADEIFVGLFPGSDGEINVSDNGELRAGGRSILVGFIAGTGTLNVSDSATVYANHDLLVARGEGSVAEINQSGGTIEAGFVFTNNAAGGAGSTVNINMTGGTFTARLAYVLGQGAGTTTMTHSGGAINALTNNGDFVVSDSFDAGNANTSTYNISGTATVNLLHNFIVAAFGESNGIVNQTGGTIVAGDGVFVGRDAVGVWNISGGSVSNTNFDFVLGNFSDASNGTVNQTGGTVDAGVNIVVGRDGTGLYNLSGGTASALNVFLGDFDTSHGTMKITGGALALGGNLNVGGPLASNAPPDGVRTGTEGQAAGANGTLIVSGNTATIDVGGNFLANPADKTRPPADANTSTLAFEIFSGAGTSLIDVVGVADLDGAVIDLDLMGGFTPTVGATFDLLTASSFGSTGTGTTQNSGTGVGFSLASEDSGAFSLAVVAGGNGAILRATFLGASVNDADFDNDDDVDGADFLIWQRNLGTGTTNLQGDANGDSAVNAADLTIWKGDFGQGTPAAAAVGAIPEPSSVLLIGVGLVALAIRRRS
jgi:T5SS/PEP-CTERM-associated repeat protein